MKAKRVLATLMLILLSLSNTGYIISNAAKYEESTGVEEEYLKTEAKVPKISADAAILMDARTGEILFQKNATKKEYPASITKCMTSLVAIENNDLNEVIEFSENAVFNVEAGSSSAGIDVGEKLTVDQTLYGAMLESANECCNALAEKTSGTIEGFVELMNQKAAEIGCVNTHFYNANGLYHKKHYTCAYDMALIVKEGMKNEDWRRYAGTVSYSGAPKNKKKEKRYWNNHHKLLNGNLSYNNGLYTVEGGKTGYTVKCQNTLVTYAKSNTDDFELICVVMRSNKYNYGNGRTWPYTYDDTKNLLDWGFSNFSTISSTVDTGTYNNGTMNYFNQTYEMLQPEKFIRFQATNDCKIAISNSYDATQLKGTLAFAGDPVTKKWGTYQFVSSGNVIASTDVYYELNYDMIKALYGTTGKMNVGQIIISTVKLILLAALAVLVIVLLVVMVRKLSERRVTANMNINFNTKYKDSLLHFKKKMKTHGKVDYGYIDYNSKKRRKRYSKKNKLHF